MSKLNASFYCNKPVKSIQYSQTLIQRPSITPSDQGCQKFLADKLTSLGFDCHSFIVNGVSNLVATFGNGPTTLAFAGHTDVVPAGDSSRWHVDPFSAQIIDGELFGRGAADMKTGLAAMLAATERVISKGAITNTRFVWLITSDEEGEAEYGSKEIAAYLSRQGISLDMCIVGEPTALLTTGDNIKVGRRGSLSGKIIVKGKQGHVAYPQYADNAVHRLNQVMSRLLAIDWDKGSDDFPGSGLQFTHVQSATSVDNIVPGSCECGFNIRFSHHWNLKTLTEMIQQQLQEFSQQIELTWERPCQSYFTAKPDPNKPNLIHSVESAIHKNTGRFPLLSTSGGTSDGRFFAGASTQVVEVGVPNNTIHQVNERIHLSELVTLEDIYTDILSDLLIS